MHDVVENTACSVDGLRTDFGDPVATYVEWLTDPSKNNDAEAKLKEHARLRRARGDVRRQLMHHWGLTLRMRKSLWDADHILPVAEGGGECDLDNIRTLCLRCHRVVTAQLRERIRRAKVAAMLIAEGKLAG